MERDYMDFTIFYGVYMVLNIMLVIILLINVYPANGAQPPAPQIPDEPIEPVEPVEPTKPVEPIDPVEPTPPPEPEPPPVEPEPEPEPQPTEPSEPQPKPPVITEPYPEPPAPEPEPEPTPDPQPQPEPEPVAKIVYSGGTNKKQVAITFDDGPDPNTLDEMLNILDQYNAKATFFLLGQRSRNSQHLLQKIHERGHQIANHSLTHPRFSTLSWNEAAREITETEKILGSYQSHKYFRPPYGDYNRQTLEVAYNLNYRVIYWNVDTRDWAATNHNQIVNVVKERTKPGSIILFHEGKQLTLKALPEVLQWLTQQGYELVTVAELLGD